MPWSFTSSGNPGGFNMQSSGNPGGFSSDIISRNLALRLDAGNPNSYPGTGTTWTDVSSNNRNATFIGTPTFDSNNGGSIIFSGDDSADVGTFFTFTNFTISTWVLAGTTQVSRANIFDNNHAGGGQNFVCQQFGGVTNLYNFNCFNATQGSTAAFSLVANIWTQVTFTWNNSVARVYINGILTSSGNTINPIRYNSPSLRIGDLVGGTRNFNGRIANFWAYDRVLSDVEIITNFNITRGRFGV